MPTDIPPMRGDGPRLASTLADDPDMCDLVELFINGLTERVAGLVGARNEDDSQRVTQIAHQLRGAAPAYGYPTIGRAAERLELRLRELDGQGDQLGCVRGEFTDLIDLCWRAMQTTD